MGKKNSKCHMQAHKTMTQYMNTQLLGHVYAQKWICKILSIMCKHTTHWLNRWSSTHLKKAFKISNVTCKHTRH